MNLTESKSERQLRVGQSAVSFTADGEELRAVDRRFPGFPQTTLLESGRLPIAQLAALALREGQCTNPLYRVHRWFARRLGSQFRAILTGLYLGSKDASKFWSTYLGDLPLHGAIVLDPFVGGGTSLIEAAQCGADVIGYDIDPVATFITRFELAASDFDSSPHFTADICASVSETMAPFHKTTVPGAGVRIVLHHFWVECRKCQVCRSTFEIHPHYQLAHNKENRLQWVFCRNCHQVAELPFYRKELRCKCGTRTKLEKGTLSLGKVHCPSCKGVSALSDRGEEPRPAQWRLFAQEYLEETPRGVSRKFKTATRGDRARAGLARSRLDELERSGVPFAPDRNIPHQGRSDQRPLIHGFRKYRELFNARQLLHLTLLGRQIADLEPGPSQTLLSLAFSEHLTTNCMYTAYAFGYRRVSPMFSIHSYRHITRPVEINPWLDGIGRGTFPNVLSKIAKGVEFAKTPSALDPNGGRRACFPSKNISRCAPSLSPQTVIDGTNRASIATRSSEDLSLIPDSSIDLILTDPPYFDNLSYSELSDFYLAWHQALGVAEPPYDDPRRSAPIRQNLALSDRADQSVEEYESRLQRTLATCNRVLKRNGILVFTYHHTSPKAWSALGNAMVRSGLKCTNVLPLRGEGQGGLHSYGGTIKWDAVFICRKGDQPTFSKITEVVVSRTAIGRAGKRVAAYRQELKNFKQIGFREPDQLNLERALIVASAVIARPSRQMLRLPNALSLIES
jgi:putative DNA methylase